VPDSSHKALALTRQLIAIAASHDGSMVASTCRASNAEHAVVRVHSTATWDPIGLPLSGHTLTITRVAFSSDDQRILSVSRDRGWRVFKRDPEGEGFALEAEDQRAHSRMILDAAWGDGMFTTASRDKTVRLLRSVSRLSSCLGQGLELGSRKVDGDLDD
jgi:WD40 repeat protein